MLIAGIDPGRDGFVVVLDALSTRAWRLRLRYCERKILQFEHLEVLPKIDLCYVEHVHGRGGWAAQSNFGLGSYFGQICLALKLYGIDYNLIRPSDWTKEMHGNLKGKSKEKTIKSYLQLFPHKPIKPRVVKGEDLYNNNLVDSFMIAVNGVLNNDFNIQKWKFED